MFSGQKKSPTNEAEANCKPFYYCPQTLEEERRRGKESITEKKNQKKKNKPQKQQCKKKFRSLKQN